MGEFIPIDPGPVVLFGSGETTSSGRKIFEQVLKQMRPDPRIMLLETPAGFELNSAQVAGRVAEFLQQRLQNYNPQTTVIPARKQGTPFSPDDPDVIKPLLRADMIFMGPGSPTYAVRQLKDSLAWQYILARHRLGAALVLASAATVAISSYALPVYEIYKVGEDIHWKPGLNFFASCGLPLVFIPHWNNNDGGSELDTSRCYIGKARFDVLHERLPEAITVVGIDEKTALMIDLQQEACTVLGLDGVTLLRDGLKERFERGITFPLSLLGEIQRPDARQGVSQDVWRLALEEHSRKDEVQVPKEVLALVQAREVARARKDWSDADELRDRIASLGWQVQDTPDGPTIQALSLK